MCALPVLTGLDDPPTAETRGRFDPGERSPRPPVADRSPRGRREETQMAVEADEARFEGFTPRDCAEPRTTGGRAWCHSDQEWCYPTTPCRGCELPQLRARLARLTDIAAT